MALIQNDRRPKNDAEPIHVTRGTIRRLTEMQRELRVNAAHVQPVERSQTADSAGGITSDPVFTDLQAWQSVTLINGWVEFGAPYLASGYWKDPFGIVHLRGMIKTGVPPSIAFVLPSGYRPSGSIIIATTSASATTAAKLIIDSSGNVTVSAGAATWTSLTGVSFRAD
jgi:hypothetical protein